jgi:hypothetical protein
MTLRLSATQLDMFFRCGEQWRRRYIAGEIIPPGIAAHVGSGLHKASEVNFSQKIETGEDLPLVDVTDAARDGYIHKLQNDGVYMTREDAQARERLFDEGLAQVIDLATVLHSEFAPSIEPVMVEREVSMVDEDTGVEWLGYIDLEETETIHELKTTGKSWSQADVDSSTQGTLYPRLIESVTGIKPAQIEFDIFRKLKTQPQLSVLFTERDDSDWLAFQQRVKTMIKMVDAGLAPPASPGSWICHPKWCGWFSVCKYVSDRRRRLPNLS